MTAWKDYQEEAAAFFRSMGLEADTDVTIQGVRTKHDIDVLVRSHHYGFDITWIVECKHWKSPVSKLHVLGLREIVTDAGADRGILLSEAGFQSGAVEASHLTNVQLTSLADMRVSTTEQISSMRLRELYDRVAECNDRYWNISKEHRIEDDLRPDIGFGGYRAKSVIDGCQDVLSRAFRHLYPFRGEALAIFALPPLRVEFHSAEHVLYVLEPLIVELEAKLSASEAKRR